MNIPSKPRFASFTPNATAPCALPPLPFLLSLLLSSLLAMSLSLFIAVPSVRADGIIIPDIPDIPDQPPYPEPTFPTPEPVLLLRETWLTIRYHRVQVTIEDQVAVTHIEQEFVNEYDWTVEGTYVFPLPDGAAISQFVMWVDGTPVEGQVLEADQARRIYEDIVRQRRDPALLEYVGRSAIQARIFPIPPGASRKVELEYTQVLPVEQGMVRYVYPLNTEKFSARPLEEVAIHVSIHSPQAMYAIYSPTHQDRVYIERDGEYRAEVGYEERNVLPGQDFELVYTVGQEPIGLNLLTYREPPDDGFFLLLAAPSVEVPEEQVVARDVILVLDVSGSMEGEKIAQAREALTYILNHLNREDRFNIVAFSTGVRSYARGMQPASAAESAQEWVSRLQAIGGTDINQALLEALAQTAPERPTVLIFLTDGLPTEGVTDIEQILANVASTCTEKTNVRIFPFGVGDDVNTVLLDTLAERHGGRPGYVRPNERIDEQVSQFYAQISTPVLSQIGLDFESVQVEELFPPTLPDLFSGSQLILVGRYRDGGATRIVLTGEVNGEPREFVYEGNFRPQGGSEFIPRLWATRKIGYLLTQIRLYGEKQEWVDAIVSLSVQYGIITPYTSFLIEEDDILTAQGQEKAVEEFMAMPTPAAVGAPAVEAAAEQAEMRAVEAVGDDNMPSEAAEVIRRVGRKTFKLQDGVWTDTTFDPSQMETVKVGFGSDTYFDLLTTYSQWGKYLALGERVIFLEDGVAYEIVPGEGEVVEIPVAQPTPGTESAQPTATPPASPLVSPSPSPDTEGGVCLGLAAIALIPLAIVAMWQYMRG